MLNSHDIINEKDWSTHSNCDFSGASSSSDCGALPWRPCFVKTGRFEQIEQWNQSYLVHGGSFAFGKIWVKMSFFWLPQFLEATNSIVETTTSIKRPTSSYIWMMNFVGKHPAESPRVAGFLKRLSQTTWASLTTQDFDVARSFFDVASYGKIPQKNEMERFEDCRKTSQFNRKSRNKKDFRSPFKTVHVFVSRFLCA